MKKVYVWRQRRLVRGNNVGKIHIFDGSRTIETFDSLCRVNTEGWIDYDWDDFPPKAFFDYANLCAKCKKLFEEQQYED